MSFQTREGQKHQSCAEKSALRSDQIRSNKDDCIINSTIMNIHIYQYMGNKMGVSGVEFGIPKNSWPPCLVFFFFCQAWAGLKTQRAAWLAKRGLYMGYVGECMAFVYLCVAFTWYIMGFVYGFVNCF